MHVCAIRALLDTASECRCVCDTLDTRVSVCDTASEVSVFVCLCVYRGFTLCMCLCAFLYVCEGCVGGSNRIPCLLAYSYFLSTTDEHYSSARLRVVILKPSRIPNLSFSCGWPTSLASAFLEHTQQARENRVCQSGERFLFLFESVQSVSIPEPHSCKFRAGAFAQIVHEQIVHFQRKTRVEGSKWYGKSVILSRAPRLQYGHFQSPMTPASQQNDRFSLTALWSSLMPATICLSARKMISISRVSMSESLIVIVQVSNAF